MTERLIIVALVVFLCATFVAYADTTLIQKGQFEVWCDGALKSGHTTYHKAVQSAVNSTNCSIKQPLVEVNVVRDVPLEPIIVAYSPEQYIARASWEAPTERTNGSPLAPDELDYYTIRLAREDGLTVDQMEVLAGQPLYERTYMLAPGKWTFTIKVTDKEGRESIYSDPISLTLPKDI